MRRKSKSPDYNIKIACHTTAVDVVKECLAKDGYEITPAKVFGQTIQLIVKARKSA